MFDVFGFIYFYLPPFLDPSTRSFVWNVLLYREWCVVFLSLSRRWNLSHFVHSFFRDFTCTYCITCVAAKFPCTSQVSFLSYFCTVSLLFEGKGLFSFPLSVLGMVLCGVLKQEVLKVTALDVFDVKECVNKFSELCALFILSCLRFLKWICRYSSPLSFLAIVCCPLCNGLSIVLWASEWICYYTFQMIHIGLWFFL
jgi:hypothetical protein